MSVESPDRGTSHPLASVLRSVIVVNHQRVTNDGGVSRQWQVGIRKEHFGGAEILYFSCHVQPAELGSEISNPAAQWVLVFLTVLVNTENRQFTILNSCKKLQNFIPAAKFECFAS